MAVKGKIDDISREEEYRDYDTRNIDQGWPYADQAGAGSDPVENAAYGDPKANFDFSIGKFCPIGSDLGENAELTLNLNGSTIGAAIVGIADAEAVRLDVPAADRKLKDGLT